MAIVIDKTISKVVESGLCTGCGTCVGICPTDAIQMVKDESKGIYLPQLDGAKCNECGICLKACPGYEVDFKTLNLEIFGKEPEDILLGNYINCYTGHATDYDIRYNSASGGLVTALLIFALEQRIIDGALVTRMNEDNPLEPQPFIATTREEIISASKSKYCPVPANIALKEILNAKGGERFAVVGLPCHIHGIRKAEEVNKKLRERAVLHLGLLCSHTPNFWGTEFLLNRMSLKKEDIIKLDYRGEGWPGSMKICLKDGQLLPDFYRGWSLIGSDFFTPARCLMCCEQGNELADISFGDAWGLADDSVGKSLVISRNKLGEDILQRAIVEGAIALKVTDRGKRGGIGLKSTAKPSLSLQRLFGNPVPFYNRELLKPGFRIYLKSMLLYFQVYIGSKRYLWFLIARLLTLARRLRLGKFIK